MERLRVLPIREVAKKLYDRFGSEFVRPEAWPSHVVRSKSLVLLGDREFRCKCGFVGNVIQFVRGVLDCDEREACAWLSYEFGVLPPDRTREQIQAIVFATCVRNGIHPWR
jgi:hypothetical protein